MFTGNTENMMEFYNKGPKRINNPISPTKPTAREGGGTVQTKILKRCGGRAA